MIKFNKLDYKILNHFKYVIMALAIMFLSINTGSALSEELQLTTNSNTSFDAVGEGIGQLITIDAGSPYFNYVKAGIRRYGTPSDLIVRIYSDVLTNPENMLEVTIPYTDIPTTACPSTPDITIPLGYVSQGAEWTNTKTDYNIAFTASTLDATNYYRVCSNTADTYAGGYKVNTNNNGANWFDESPADIQFKLIYDIDHFNITWNKQEYAKGEKATITATFNASSYDKTNYQYTMDIRDPVTYEHTYISFNSNSISTGTYTFQNVGEFDVSVYVKTTDPDSAHYFDRTDNDVLVSSFLSPQSFISWQNQEYEEGQTGKLSWGISDSVQYLLLSKNIIIYRDNIQVDQYENLNYFGSINYQFDKKGVYRADLIVASPIAQTVINSAETTVVLGESYISTNATLQAGFLNNFSYKWGFTPTSIGNKWLHVKYWDNDNYEWKTESTIALSGNIKDTVYTSTFLVKNVGEYLLELCDINRFCPATSLKVNSVYVPQQPIYNYATSSITITSTLATYAQGDTLKWRSQIKGTDFSNKTATVEIKNNATAINYTLLYVQTDFEEQNYYLGQLYGGGASMLQLVGRNVTGAYVLAQTPITMSITDSGGWGLDISETKICIDGNVKITAISPSNATIRFTDKKITQYNFSGTRTFNIKPNDDMTISLEDNGIQKKYGFIDVNPDCEAVTVDDTGTINSVSDLEYSTTGSGRKLDELVLIMGMGLNDTSKLIFAVLMIAIALCIMYITTHSVFVAIASGSAIFIWMLAISYIPLWVVILVAITLIMKARQGE